MNRGAGWDLRRLSCLAKLASPWPASQMETLPNFLIVGAAKCGTTSLYYYLRQHPEIFLSANKEPKFFSSLVLKFPLRGPGDDFVEKHRMVKSWEAYGQLFAEVRAERAVGEASTDYLYRGRQIIPHIRQRLGDPRIIILLRDPVERAFSSWRHLRRDGRETASFDDALEAERERQLLNWEFIWSYKDVGFYAAQVRAYLENFSRVHVCLFEDFAARPGEELRAIYRFLDVSEAFEADTSRVYNPGTAGGVSWLGRLLTTTAGTGNARTIEPRTVFRSRLGRRLVDFILRASQESMSPTTGARLQSAFREDVARLGALLNRDLSHWLK